MNLNASNQPRQASLVETLIFGVRYVEKCRTWLVVVCPEEALSTTQSMLMGVLPSDAQVFGRTVKFPSGGHISLVPSYEAVFVPKNTPFDVMFLRWEEAHPRSAADMLRWRAAAGQVLSPTSHD
jgi:hypothetical protein